MRKGKLINGYLILKNFTTAGGGLSKWTFAQKHGIEYFIKEFLHPTYPDDGSFGSERVKNAKREECEVFEQHHQGLMEAISSSPVPMGNLVVAHDFFRYGSKYYKVTEKIEFDGLKTRQVPNLPQKDKFLLMTTLSKSLLLLHQLNIVHGDLKPENLLVKKTLFGKYISKLIDFDNSYFSGKPPMVREELVGDMVFYSPEMARYIMGDTSMKSHHLTQQSDIFALGLLFSFFIDGRLPEFDQAKYKYACLSILHGKSFTVSSKNVSEEFNQLINAMLVPNPNDRPNSDYIFNFLKTKIDLPSESQITSVQNLLDRRKVAPKILRINKDNSDTNLKGTLMD